MNKALFIDGYSKYCVRLDKETKLFNQSFTKEFLIRTNSINSRQILLGDYNTSNGSDTNLEIYDDKFRLYWNCGEIDKKFGKLEKDTITHVAWVRDKMNNKQIVYVNGSVELITDIGTDLKCDGIYYIGKDGRDSLIFNGLIDEYRVWNYARSENEIKDNIKTIIDSNSLGLILYYRFDNDKDNIINDISNHNNNGYVDALNIKEYKSILKYYKYLIKKDGKLYNLNNAYYSDGNFIQLDKKEILSTDYFFNINKLLNFKKYHSVDIKPIDIFENFELLIYKKTE